MKRIAQALAPHVVDVLMLAGAGLVSYGAWLIYAPAGYISCGVLLLAGGVLAARRDA
ncbi:hypothetical protein SNE35_28700 [Paucibacter sp. R3-3]|uniref:Uncharacterized protein n=1 Tax=Roseateles agri TaxID=3098619 RepID=A0ABU5DT11_9BURK|nr:hypothetical protein [Paucibacter sp. R3-3]MDY0748514.1 hypothetical protein [Paucibacter sp. R3-3]